MYLRIGIRAVGSERKTDLQPTKAKATETRNHTPSNCCKYTSTPLARAPRPTGTRPSAPRLRLTRHLRAAHCLPYTLPACLPACLPAWLPYTLHSVPITHSPRTCPHSSASHMSTQYTPTRGRARSACILHLNDILVHSQDTAINRGEGHSAHRPSAMPQTHGVTPIARSCRRSASTFPSMFVASSSGTGTGAPSVNGSGDCAGE